MDKPASATKARQRRPAVGQGRRLEATGTAAGTRGKHRANVQYTVRDIPAHVDGALRSKARQEGKSLNRVLCETLAREAGVSAPSQVLHHDLDDLAGKWEDDSAFDQAVAAQNQIDESLWR